MSDPRRSRSSADDDKGDSKRREKAQESALDEALKDTFPASDPVSIEQPAHHRPPLKPDDADDR